MAERLALPTSDHGVAGSNPAGGEILPEPKRRFIAQSRSCSPFHRLEMTEIVLKGRKTLTHPSIQCKFTQVCICIHMTRMFRYTLLQKFLQANIIFFHQSTHCVGDKTLNRLYKVYDIDSPV